MQLATQRCKVPRTEKLQHSCNVMNGLNWNLFRAELLFNWLLTILNISALLHLPDDPLWSILEVSSLSRHLLCVLNNQTLRFILAVAHQVSLEWNVAVNRTAGSLKKKNNLAVAEVARWINTLLDTYQLSLAALRAKGSLCCTRIKHEPQPENPYPLSWHACFSFAARRDCSRIDFQARSPAAAWRKDLNLACWSSPLDRIYQSQAIMTDLVAAVKSSRSWTRVLTFRTNRGESIER